MAKQIIWQELKDLVLGLGYAAGKPNEIARAIQRLCAETMIETTSKLKSVELALLPRPRGIITR